MSKPDKIDNAVLDELRAWGGPNEMSAFEAVMWLAEVDPRLRSTIVSVMELDRVPDWERFKADHRWLSEAVPRFRQKVVVPKGVGNPVWVEDPEFDLDYHVRRVRLPEPGDSRQMFDVGAFIAMAPFDRARAPWEATLVEGLEGGRAAYILKMHHATTDGLGIVQLMSRVFSRDREASTRPLPPPRQSRQRPAASAASLGFKALRKRLLSLPRNAVEAAGDLGRQVGHRGVIGQQDGHSALGRRVLPVAFCRRDRLGKPRRFPARTSGRPRLRHGGRQGGPRCAGHTPQPGRPLGALGVDLERGVLRLSFVHYTSQAEVVKLITALDAVL